MLVRLVSFRNVLEVNVRMFAGVACGEGENLHAILEAEGEFLDARRHNGDCEGHSLSS
jgi:hypothetical protein